MHIPNHAELLEAVEAFIARHAMAETRFGRDAINNPNFIRGLRDGVSPTLDTLTKVRDFMHDYEAEVATRAKLTAPPPEPVREEEIALPFPQAPVNPTGASSPTSSTTTERPTSLGANGSSPTSSTPADGPRGRRRTSCSGADA